MAATHRSPTAEIKAITANRLSDGVVVFLDEAGGWVERLGDAALYDDVGTAAALGVAKRAEAERIVVESYVIGVSRAADGPVPVTAREIIRARGPSVRLDLGKQAEPA